jgi:glycosyltransferase involved in cell wall biosynthesis
MKTNNVIITIGPWHEKPWWWQHIRHNIYGACNVEYVRIRTGGNKKEKELLIWQMPMLFLRIIGAVRKYKPKHVFTFECGLASLTIAALQKFGFMKSTKHIILQFIMGEKEKTLMARIKYMIKRIIYSSINTAVCSSTKEVSYYQKAFGWNDDKIKFIPFHCDPSYLKYEFIESGNYVFSAGRTFRDYDTFLDAAKEINYPVIIAASPWNINKKKVFKNVSVKYDIPLFDLDKIMSKSKVVVIPLDDKNISTGQSVILQAMAMGKAIVATDTSGTMDYIKHFYNGLLVPPRDSRKMKQAIEYLLKNESERVRIGKNAREWVMRVCLPKHYYEEVRKIVCYK